MEEQKECIKQWPIGKVGNRYMDFASIAILACSAAQVKFVEDEKEVQCIPAKVPVTRVS